MKRKFEHPAPSERELTGPRYWRSLDELAETPGFQAQLAREFPEGAAQLDGVDRRAFFKLMAASFALGGLGLAAGCRRPEQNILPYGKSVEGVIPGLPQYYATAMPRRRHAIPLLAETHQGRPTKLEGNPTYLPYGGATSLTAQASLLDLYDPDRATTHTIKGTAATAAEIDSLLAKIGQDAATTNGAGLAFLADASSSPTRARLVASLKQKLPSALWSEYEPVQDEAPAAASELAFGRPGLKPVYHFAKAKRIVSIDADFLQSEANSLGYARDFATGRRVKKPSDPMNRLYVAESTFTLTGSMADHRLRLASSDQLAFAAALVAQITGNTQAGGLAEKIGVDSKWISACADDLLANRGASLLIAGAHLPAEVHALVYAANSFLGNVGQTVDIVEAESAPAISINDVAAAIKAGTVKTLVILGGNPAYDAPADLDWAALQKSVGNVVRLGYYVDETSVLNTAATTHIAAAHYLESWGDARTSDGTLVPVQPMILPLFGGLTEIEVLARITGETTSDPYALVYNTVTKLITGDVAKGFRRFLHDGVLEGSAYRPVPVTARPAAELITSALGQAASATFSKDNLEVRFTTDHKADDGRYANNGWLQECPDPITKIAWDNAISVSPRLAKAIGIDPKGALIQVARKELSEMDRGRENAFIGEVTVNGRTVRGPLHIQPGLANWTIVLPLGYGRTVSGRVGKGTGHNFYTVRTSAGLHVATGATIKVTTDRYSLANTQEHWSMEGRDIVREANFEGKDGYQENPGFVAGMSLEAHSPAVYGNLSAEEFSKLPADERARITAERATEIPRGGSLYVTPKFSGDHQWGMSIDLNTCIGCNACVVACQAENNIPIVGKDQVLRGREMHWIRLDRYYSDGKADAAAFGGPENREIPEDPQASIQPVGCMHCELAPCETVCPVNATVHDTEGINTMAYNRCIGTRYCANNCPFKVRRFNYFDFNKRQLDSLYLGPLGPSGMPELVKMVKNPEVTVRMRGVREKCTYCIQRIENGKIRHKVKMTQDGHPGDVVVPDGVIKTACQQVCPAESIVFGNLLDKESAVSKAKACAQDYELLGYLNIRPRTTYLGKLRNPNYNMPGFENHPLPFSRQENLNKNHPGGAHGAEGGAAEGGHASLPTGRNHGGLS